MDDFENSSRSAVLFHWPGVIIRGCFFHFRHAIFRRVSIIGLRTDYNRDNYREFINSFGALALEPIANINEALAIIKSKQPNDPKCNQLYNYFVKQWIERVPPKYWNHFDHSGRRTKISKLLTMKHPNIFILINFIKKLNFAAIVDVERLKQGFEIT